MRTIFVFGSNLAGRHGKGAARDAINNYGAIWGQGVGLQGNSYAIPTKDHSLRPLPLHLIKGYVDEFLKFARTNPRIVFNLTPIGTGLAGYTDLQIAPMFAGYPNNVHIMRAEWLRIIRSVEQSLSIKEKNSMASFKNLLVETEEMVGRYGLQWMVRAMMQVEPELTSVVIEKDGTLSLNGGTWITVDEDTLAAYNLVTEGIDVGADEIDENEDDDPEDDLKEELMLISDGVETIEDPVFEEVDTELEDA